MELKVNDSTQKEAEVAQNRHISTTRKPEAGKASTTNYEDNQQRNS